MIRVGLLQPPPKRFRPQNVWYLLVYNMTTIANEHMVPIPSLQRNTFCQKY